MTAISDSEIISRLSKLSISHPEVIQHGSVSGSVDWKAELEKKGKTGVALTKTVRVFENLPSLIAFNATPSYRAPDSSYARWAIPSMISH